MTKLGRKKLPIGEKKLPIVINMMFLPKELKEFGGKEEVKQRAKQAIKKEFYGI